MRAGKTMRQVLATIILMGTANIALAQIAAHKSAEQAVRDALKVTSSGYYTSSTEKDLETLGDAAAIEIIRLFAARDLGSQEIRSSLEIIKMSFSSPKLIATETNRHPRASLLLLRYLDYQAKEPALKKGIADTSRSLGALPQ